jgi:4-amino-4-deoxy-L-arabinose transferase-like glycosyltransferase
MNRNAIYILIITASGIFFFLPFLGRVHLFDWDEINFAESAREMIVTGNYSRVQINFVPFWEKPPLFFWLQALSMHIFGINEFAARFPNALTGIITLLTLYLIGKKLRSEQFGFLWALSYLGSFLPHLYFKSGIIDPVFNYFIFLSVFFIALSNNKTDKKLSPKYAMLSGIAAGLATLTKGPVALLILMLCVMVYWVTGKLKKFTTGRNILMFAASFIIISSLWFGIEIINNGFWFIKEFIRYQADLLLTPVAGHQGPVYYHFVVVFLGCFPFSVFAVPLMVRIKPGNSAEQFPFQKWMLILFWTVIILFTVVKTKIVHYSSLAYFPLSYIAADYLQYAISKGELKKYIIIILAVTGTLFSLLLFSLPLLFQNKQLVLSYLKDPFAAACLNTSVSWGGYEHFIGIIYFLLLLISVVIISRKHILIAAVILFYSTALTVFIYLVTVVPKIEKYTQAPAVDFYQSLKAKDVYVKPVGFKSYAQYFYFEKQPGTPSESDDELFLLKGNIDKPAYFVARITGKEIFDSIPDCKLIKQEGGFLFYERIPVLHNK